LASEAITVVEAVGTTANENVVPCDVELGVVTVAETAETTKSEKMALVVSPAVIVHVIVMLG